MIGELRQYLEHNELDALLVNSTNEYLVEYNALEENSRYLLTGFSGSTGDAVVTRDKVYLFVDGRYHIQADNEVNSEVVTIVKMQTGETFLSKLKEVLPENSCLGIVAKKNSQDRYENLKKCYNVVLLDYDILERRVETFEKIEEIDFVYCGLAKEDKISKIREKLQDGDALLVSSLEEVSYLFNLRDFSKPYSSKISRRALITKDYAKLYSVSDYEEYKKDLLSIKGKIFVDKKSVNARDYSLIADKAVQSADSDVQYIHLPSDMKSVKTSFEIEHYKDCFRKTDLAVKAIRSYIENNDNISEFDIDKKLEEYFYQYGARSLSFKSIVAKDKNSALAHYSKSSKNEIIKDGSLILIDCGAYYEGGLATDITRVFVKGQPNNLQRQVYTTVLKAFLNAYNTPIIADISGFDIDSKVREFFESNPVEGFVFNHGLGHGIGISVHEYPPNLSCNKFAKVPLKEGNCFTIEPGLYNKDYFGVRLENSCYLYNGKIHSFVKMNYEKKLIDFDRLSAREKIWLEEFEVI